MKTNPARARIEQFDKVMWLNETAARTRTGDGRIKRRLRDAAAELAHHRQDAANLRAKLASESVAWDLLARMVNATDALLVVPPLRASAFLEAREDLAETARQCRQAMRQ